MSITKASNNIEIFLSKEQINKCIDNVASTLLKQNKFIHLICILNGAKKFTDALSEIFDNKNIDYHISYIKAKATRGTELRNKVILEEDNIAKPSFFNKETSHIITDDLIDSGKTTLAVKKYLHTNKYKNIKILTLINKYKNNNIADIVGYDLALDKEQLKKQNIKDYWLFGYGMDLNGDYRELDEIRALRIAT